MGKNNCSVGRLGQRPAQGAHSLGVIRPTAGEFDCREGVLAAGDACGVSHGRGQQATQPWNLRALELVRITAAVESLVVRANYLADGRQSVPEACQLLAEDGVLSNQRPLRFAQRIGLLLPATDQIARQLDQADVVEPSADLECLAL